MIEKIVIIGAIATQKTQIGKMLAEKLDMFFATTEELLEYENHDMKEIKRLFGDEGVEKYKNRTIKGIKDLQNCVLVAYDNCLETESQRGIIAKDAVVVHLYASSESTATRLRKSGKKGTYSVYEIEEIQRKLLPIYNKLSNIRISINRKKADVVVDQIIDGISKLVEREMEQ